MKMPRNMLRRDIKQMKTKVIPDKRNKEIRERAEKKVLEYRGSYDAPGFDACVEAEIEIIKSRGRVFT